MQHDPKTGPPNPGLAHELFNLVESDQGHAFISDGCEVLSTQEIFNLAQAALKYSRRVVRTLEGFMLREAQMAGGK